MFDHTVGPGGRGAAAGAVRATVGRGGPAPVRAGGVPGGAVVRGVWAALCEAERPVTAREIANLLGTRRESANRALCQLERAGWARRERGDARTSTPDLWSPVLESQKIDLAGQDPQAGRMAAATEATLPASPVSVRRARMRAACSTPPSAPETCLELAPRRLVAGELQEQVYELLQSRSGGEFSPLQLARALGGRSQGAVVNACKRLVAKGEAVCTCQAPLRFMAADQLK